MNEVPTVVARHRWVSDSPRRARLTQVALAVVCALFATGTASPLTAGDKAPACVAASLDGGNNLDLSDYKGQVVYLDFWASWCAPCRESFPFMNELNRELGGKGLRIIAVSVDKTEADARRFLSRYPAEFTTVLDTSGACPAAFRVQGMPSSYLIGRDGNVRSTVVGFHDSERADIRRAALEALGETR